jgi:serine phosphatase RsbU (regulator of sigma subunit)
MLTGQGDEAVAVAAMKIGASDYLNKNDLSAETLDLAIRTAIEKAERHSRRVESRARLQKEYLNEKERRLELEASLQIAGDIQQNLLPSGPPHLPGFDVAGVCLPSDATGGRFLRLPLRARGNFGDRRG